MSELNQEASTLSRPFRPSKNFDATRELDTVGAGGDAIENGRDENGQKDNSRLDGGDVSEEIPSHWNQNLFRIVVYQMVLRIGWIFKTETVVMPAVIDLISGAGWIRGFLPIFNRFGQSIPPLLASGWLASRKLKKWVLFSTTLSMAVCFAFLSVLIGNRGLINDSLIVVLFIVIYAIFFCCVGLNQTVLNTLHGKLLPAKKRGLLMVFSSTIGVVGAVSCVSFVLPFWLNESTNAFHLIFATSALLFFVSSIIAICFIEPVDRFPPPRTRFWKRIPEAFQVLRKDRDFRTFTLVAAIFGSSISLLPHYQSMAKTFMEVDVSWLLPWLVAQNIGSAIFGSLSGYFADRIGNRLTLRAAMFIQATIPAVAVAIVSGFSSVAWAYVAVFFLLGNTPVIFRICNNYALESTGVQQHPKYLSLLAACYALPCILLSIPVGYLVDRIGFYPVFFGQSAVLFGGFLLTFLIVEPRDKKES